MALSLQEFFEQSQKQNFFSGHRIILFSGIQEYPILFFSLVFEHLKKQYDFVESIDVKNLDFASVEACLETTFLGAGVMYMLRGLHELDKPKQQKIFNLVCKYQGPHTLFLFTAQDEQALNASPNLLKIALSDILEISTFNALLQWRYSARFLAGTKQFVTLLFKHYGKVLPLDPACVLLHYAPLVGTNLQEFGSHWLDYILIPEASLFTLSQYFFAKNYTAFYALWSTIGDAYTSQFWISFWSEQLFRADNFVQLSLKNRRLEAKKIAFRLPFSFMQRSWRHYKDRELKNAHQFIYAIDYRIKNGCDSFALELFYSKFFLNKFV